MSVVRIPTRAGLVLTLEVDASEPIAALERLADSLREDPRPFYREAGAILRRSWAENFRAGGRPHRWRELSPNTIAQKNELGPSLGFPYATPAGRLRVRRLAQRDARGQWQRSTSNILIARGDLRDSAVQLGKAGHVQRVTEDGIQEGTSHWLARIHQFGTGPYTIRPRRAKRLSFITAGGRVSARSVRHPGVPARPFLLMQDEDRRAIMALARGRIRL